MAQAADYGDAHLRHWEDAELLFNDDRWANADQLYGFSAECGLKALMRALGGMPVDATGKPTSTKHLKHIREFGQYSRRSLTGRSAHATSPCSPMELRLMTGLSMTATQIGATSRKQGWNLIAPQLGTSITWYSSQNRTVFYESQICSL